MGRCPLVLQDSTAPRRIFAVQTESKHSGSQAPTSAPPSPVTATAPNRHRGIFEICHTICYKLEIPDLFWRLSIISNLFTNIKCVVTDKHLCRKLMECNLKRLPHVCLSN